MPSSLADLRAYVRDVSDFPKPGILFRDLTPLMANGAALATCVSALAERAAAFRPDVLAAIESRGFIFGAAAAVQLGVGLVPIRKPGKLPHRTRRVSYQLEYGTDGVEIHEDALAPGRRVLIVDDVLATGGTAGAAIRLVRELGADVVAAVFVLELGALGGRARLADVEASSLLVY